jgi:hypothetical protein
VTRLGAFVLPVLAAVLLAAAYLLAGLPWPALALVLFFLYWGYSFFRQKGWVAASGLLAIFGFASAGIAWASQVSGRELTFPLVLASVLFALSGWDLAALDARTRRAGAVEQIRQIEARHYARLGLALAFGLALALLALNLKIDLSFGWALVVVLLAVLGLAILVRALLQNQDTEP